MNYTSSNDHSCVIVGCNAETVDNLLDDENDLSDGVCESACDITTGFSLTMQRF